MDSITKTRVKLSPLLKYTIQTNVVQTSLLLNSSTPVKNGSYFDRDVHLAKVEVIFLSIFLYFALFGNILVLIELHIYRQKLTKMQWFVKHLCLADIFVAFFNITPQLVMDVTNQFYAGDIVCRSVKYLALVGMYASSYVLVMGSADRYASICHPLNKYTLSSNRNDIMIVTAWVASFLLAIPQVFIFRLLDMGGGNECFAVFQPVWGIKVWVTWLFSSIYAVPFFLLVYLNIRLCFIVKSTVDKRYSNTCQRTNNLHCKTPGSGISWWRMPSRSRKREIFSNVSGTLNSVQSGEDEKTQNKDNIADDVTFSRQKNMYKSKIKAVKLTLTVVICYLVCWAPFFIVNMLTVWDTSVKFEGPVFTIIALLSSLNSCTNPWIYLAITGKRYICFTKNIQNTGFSRSRSTRLTTNLRNTVESTPLRLTCT